jgi:hypothetical protein
MRLIRSRFTSAHLIALLALFVALGGSAYAFHLGKNAVKTKNIKDGAVTEAKLANGAVTTAKLAAGAVKSPSVVVRVASKPLNEGSNAVPEAHCQPGEVATGGGGLTANQSADVQLNILRPLQASGASAQEGDTPGAFQANFISPSGGGVVNTTVFAYVLCMKT